MPVILPAKAEMIEFPPTPTQIFAQGGKAPLGTLRKTIIEGTTERTGSLRGFSEQYSISRLYTPLFIIRDWETLTFYFPAPEARHSPRLLLEGLPSSLSLTFSETQLCNEKVLPPYLVHKNLS